MQCLKATLNEVQLDQVVDLLRQILDIMRLNENFWPTISAYWSLIAIFQLDIILWVVKLAA